MDAFEILVIILSVALLLFIIVSIVALSLLIQVLKRVRAASETAQHAAANVEQFTSQLRNAGKATAVGSMVAQVMNIIKKGKK